MPEKQLASLEMQEAVLAKKLVEMYEKLINLDKSSFFYLYSENNANVEDSISENEE